MKFAVIGDVGGHATEFAALLTQVGCDPETGTIPEDLTIIQVGDLIHRGPDSPGVVRLVDRFLTGPDADRWRQLIGNHEAQYLRPGEPTFQWPETLPADTIATLDGWWQDGRMNVAADAGGVLVTHAGLTSGFWGYIGAPASAAVAARALNGLPRHRLSPLWTDGMMLSGAPVMDAGVLWASAAGEVIPSWMGRRAPFHQIAGHSTVKTRNGRWWTHDPAVQAAITSMPEDAMAVAAAGERQIWCIDPGHGSTPMPGWNAVHVEAGRVRAWPR